MQRRRLNHLIAGAILASVLGVEAVIFVPSYLREAERLEHLQAEELERAVADVGHFAELTDVGPADVAAILGRHATGVSVVDGHGAEVASNGRLPETTPDPGLANDCFYMERAVGDTGLVARLWREDVGISRQLHGYALRIAGLVALIAAAVAITTVWVFRRQVLLPGPVDDSRPPAASVTNGMLRIVVPRGRGTESGT